MKTRYIMNALGVGQDRMTSTLLSSTRIPLEVTTYPRKVILLKKKVHFLRLAKSFYFSSTSRFELDGFNASFHSYYGSKCHQSRQPQIDKCRTKHLVHKPHESDRGIGQIEWHHKPLIQTPFGLKRRLPFINLSNANLVVSTPQIHLREHTRAMKLIQHVLKPWDRVPILDGDPVDCTAIHIHAHATILLRDKEG